jgi:hypothetical protein
MAAKRRLTRRGFLRRSGLVTAGAVVSVSEFGRPLPAARRWTKSKLRPDLLDENSPPGIEVVQLTCEREVPSSHVYMEAQVFTLDSQRLVLHRSASAHGSSQHDPEHRYLLCDLADDCSLSPLTDEVGATGPSVSPDENYLYYFVNATTVGV